MCVPDGGLSSNASCTLISISTLLSVILIWTMRQ